jgi:C4-dicarboxylate-specific signal transduction histidine kinase
MGDPGRGTIWRHTVELARNDRSEPWLRLEEVLRGTVGAVRARAAQKRLTLRMSMPTDFPTVRADANKLRQLWVVLFLAAIENTPDHGQVSFDIEWGDGREIILLLAGTGNRLSREEIEAAVTPFVSLGSFKIESPKGPGASVILRWREKR